MSELDIFGVPVLQEQEEFRKPLNKAAINQFVKVCGSRNRVEAVVNQVYNTLSKNKENYFLVESGVSYFVNGSEMSIYRGIGSNQDEFVSEKVIRFGEPKRLFEEVSKEDDTIKKVSQAVKIGLLDVLDELYKDKLSGGLADANKPSDFNLRSLLSGVVIELEHTSDEMTALEIAMDHLKEDQKYYEKLKKIHKENFFPELPE